MMKKALISRKHKANLFKLQLMPCFKPTIKKNKGESIMLKKIVLSLVILSALICVSSCAKETKELTCDSCGKKVEVEADSKMEEDWILFCEECGEPDITFENPFEQQ